MNMLRWSYARCRRIDVCALAVVVRLLCIRFWLRLLVARNAAKTGNDVWEKRPDAIIYRIGIACQTSLLHSSIVFLFHSRPFDRPRGCYRDWMSMQDVMLLFLVLSKRVSHLSRSLQRQKQRWIVSDVTAQYTIACRPLVLTTQATIWIGTRTHVIAKWTLDAFTTIYTLFSTVQTAKY